jgi:hypothetical protein
MKAYLFMCMALVGCLKPIPPEPPKPIVVVIEPPTVKVQVIEVIPDPEPPVHTWMTGEELQKVLDERHRQAVADGQECDEGDPLCEVIP